MIIFRAGDVNPLEYGGGVLFEDARDSYTLEYTYGQECDCPQASPEEARLDVFVVAFEGSDDLVREHNWANLEDVSSSSGISVEELRALGTSTPSDKVTFLELIAGHYGWAELDNCPEQYSLEELEEKWQ